MRKVFFILLAIALSGAMQTAMAQTDAEKLAEKSAKKREKEMTKDGWKTQAGPSLFEMLKRMDLMMAEMSNINASPMNRFVYANGDAVAGTLAVAQRAAISKAKEEIIISIKSQIQGYVEGVMANAQLNSNSAVTSDEMVSKFTTKAAGDLNGAITVVNAYRQKDLNYEVQVAVLYDVVKATKDEIIKKLKEKLKDNPQIEEDVKRVQQVPIPTGK